MAWLRAALRELLEAAGEKAKVSRRRLRWEQAKRRLGWEQKAVPSAA